MAAGTSFGLWKNTYNFA